VALQRAQRTVLWIVPLIRAIQLAMYPLVFLLNGLGNVLLRLIGIRRDRTTHEHYRTPEELAYLVRETAAGGLLRRESARVVQELLDFGALTAAEVMVPRVHVVGLPLGAGREEIRSALVEQPHTRYPVYDGTLERIVGMIHVKDLLRCLATGKPLAPDQARPVAFIPPTAKTDQVLAAMNQARSQLAVVLDEHGGTGGIITVEDLFEEIVGEFGEDLGGRPELHTDGEGRLHAAGTVRLERLGGKLGVVLEHEEVDTVGGLVLAILGRPPALGDIVVYGGVGLKVVAVEGHGVAEVLAWRKPAASVPPGCHPPSPGRP
jgi:CBS domain containing-hemolysin-like protein